MSSFSLSLAYFFFNYTFHSHMFTALRYGWQPKFAHTYSYVGLQITNSYQILCNGQLYKTFFTFSLSMMSAEKLLLLLLILIHPLSILQVSVFSLCLGSSLCCYWSNENKEAFLCHNNDFSLSQYWYHLALLPSK